jgi:hypothetical protein
MICLRRNSTDNYISGMRVHLGPIVNDFNFEVVGECLCDGFRFRASSVADEDVFYTSAVKSVDGCSRSSSGSDNPACLGVRVPCLDAVEDSRPVSIVAFDGSLSILAVVNSYSVHGT